MTVVAYEAMPEMESAWFRCEKRGLVVVMVIWKAISIHRLFINSAATEPISR